MATVKVPSLPLNTTLNDADLVLLVDQSEDESQKVTVAQLAAKILETESSFNYFLSTFLG